MDEVTLKPCPFCSAAGQLKGSAYQGWWVECSKCNCLLDYTSDRDGDDLGLNHTEETAIAAWNQRADAQVEPVAWKNYAEDGDWWLTCYQEPPDSCERSEPLYTHPPAQAVAALVEAAKWCADDLESEIRSRWIEPDTGLPHPANQHRYDRDMETVRDLRTALAKYERNGHE